MKKLKRRRVFLRGGITFAALILIVCSMSYMSIYLHYVLPYRNFIANEGEVVERLKMLNHDLLAHLPPPEGVTEEHASDGDGGSYYHGTYLWVDYEITNSTAEKVFDHYDQMLSLGGWTKTYDLIYDQESYDEFSSLITAAMATSQSQSNSPATPVSTSAKVEIPTSREAGYSLNTGCFKITIYPDKYWLVIWHDFESQAPDLEIPPMWYMQLSELGETHIDTCP
jgi:hypothetical protein